MEKTRSNAWDQQEDYRVKDIVINAIKSGHTQLHAFSEAAKELGRSSSAVGFRWNAMLRSQYADEVAKAKEARQRVERRIEVELNTPTVDPVEEEEIAPEEDSKEQVSTPAPSIGQPLAALIDYVITLERENAVLRSKSH